MEPHLPPPLALPKMRVPEESYYGMVTWQATSKLQLGACYAEAFANKRDRSGNTILTVPRHTAWQKDLAFAVAFQATENLLTKIEYHAMNGTKLVDSFKNGDAAHWGANWGYLVLKSTFSF